MARKIGVTVRERKRTERRKRICEGWLLLDGEKKNQNQYCSKKKQCEALR